MRLSVALVFLALLAASLPATASYAQPPLVLHAGRQVVRSLDGGQHWQRVATPFGGSEIYQVVTDPRQSAQLYAATEQGLYVSLNGGETWERKLPGGGGSVAVLTVAVMDRRLWAGTPDGLWWSQDGGQTWQKAEGFPSTALPLTIQAALGHPAIIYVGTEHSGVLRSEDGGTSWQPVNQGLPEAIGAAPVTPVRNLAIDPSDADTVYASTEVNGIYKTTDGGRHWQPINRGLPGLAPYRTYHPLLAIDPERPETVYAVIGYPVHSHKLENKVYRTTDGGAHWQAIWNLPPNVVCTSLSVNPHDAQELIVGHDGGITRVPTTALPLPVRLPRRTAVAAGVAADVDIGDIAVLHNQRGDLSHLFDLDDRTLQLIPRQGGYRIALEPARFESDLGMRLELRDNDAVEVALPFSFQFFGQAYASVFVGSNGYVTFGRRDVLRTPSLSLFASRSPRIAPSWDDYDPTAAPEGGGVFVRLEATQAVITWKQVPQVRQNDSNTFQLVLRSNHTILITYNGVTNPDGFIGLSPGNMTPEDIIFVRFSASSSRSFPAVPIAEVFDGEFDVRAIARRFYQSHPDAFEFLVIWGASSVPGGAAGAGAFAFYLGVQNRIQGIGVSTFNFTQDFGSRGRLEGVLNMNSLNQYPSDPDQRFFGTNSTMALLGHEAGHRWLARLRFRDGNRNSTELLGRQGSHWSFFFDSDASVMEGNNWRDNGDGTFTTDAATDMYSALDKYAMGLRPPTEVPDFWFIRDPSRQQSCFDEGPQSCPPQLNVTTAGTRVNVSINQVIAAERARSPAFGAAPTTFRYAFILIVPEGLEPTAEDLAKLDAIRRRWETFFPQVTDGRGTAITRLRDGTS